MNAGFACLEAGFCRAKNAVNILTKNFIVFGITLICFWAIGFAVMFSDGNP
jgi:Amt family ammonium transporter